MLDEWFARALGYNPSGPIQRATSGLSPEPKVRPLGKPPFSEKGLRTVEYKDTEHYRVTRAFLDRPEQSCGGYLRRMSVNE
jgi:hypothetical protein